MTHFFSLRTIRLISLCMMLMATGAAMAQSSGDRLYSQGLDLQKTQTEKAQNQAISKFQSAKKLYDSKAKKKQCDDAIAVSRSIIKSIHSGGGRTRVVREVVPAAKQAVLELSNEKLQLTSSPSPVNITVSTTEDEWTVTPIANDNGESFVSLRKSQDGSFFEVICSENTKTASRQQTVEVRAADLKRELVVEQSGRPVKFSVETNMIEFNSKGGKKSVDVYSNSDILVAENNNLNWEVLSAPSWITVVGEEKKEAGVVGKFVKKAKNLVVKESEMATAEGVVVSVMKIVVAKKSPTAPARKDEIILKSADQQFTVVVYQN